MALSWNEIKDRALKFTKEWEGETRERAEKDTFWNDFFHIFGITRRRLATFEEPVKKLNNKQGFIDLFWKGTLLVDHKSFNGELNLFSKPDLFRHQNEYRILLHNNSSETLPIQIGNIESYAQLFPVSTLDDAEIGIQEVEL